VYVVEQRGLANARLASDDKRPARAPADIVEQAIEQLNLPLPS
jgi:hypothetical protein